MRMEWGLLLWITVGCGGVSSSTETPVDAPAMDAPVDAPRMCDPLAKFGAPMPIPGLAMVDGGTARLSPDELTIYFSSTAPAELWVAHRSASTEAFGAPALIAAQNSSSLEFDPTVSSDGLTLWFSSNRVANEGTHLYVATRASTLAEFGVPGVAATINATDTTQADVHPFLTADGNELWFVSSRAGGGGALNIWHAARTSGGFAPPAIVPELNSSSEDWLPTLSADRLTVYFASTRPAAGTKGGFDTWRSHRSTVNDGFREPTLVDELNTAGNEAVTWLSADNCRVYGAGASSGSGIYRLYVATRQP